MYTETPETQNDWLIELVGFNQSLLHKSYVDVWIYACVAKCYRQIKQPVVSPYYPNIIPVLAHWWHVPAADGSEIQLTSWGLFS